MLEWITSYSLPHLTHYTQLAIVFICTLITAPLVVQIVIRYPYYLEQGYREEAKSIIKEPPLPPFSEQQPLWLLPLTAILIYVLLMIPLSHVQTLTQAIALLFLTGYVISQCLTGLHTNILLDELNSVALWAGLILSAFDAHITPKAAILGAASYYSIFWTISKARTQRISCIANIFPPKFAAICGAWLGFSNVLPVLIIGLLITGVLLLLKFIFIKKLHLEWLPTRLHLPFTTGMLMTLWYFYFFIN